MATPPTPEHSFENWEWKLIRNEIAAFQRGEYEFLYLSSDELEQELALCWWQRRGAHDAGRASKRAWLKVVARSLLRDLAKAERAERRGSGQRTISLDVPVDAEGATLGDLRPDPQEPFDRRADLDLDLARVDEHLSKRQRRVLGGLLLQYTRTELAKDLGVSRDTVQVDIGRIREIFRTLGLRPDGDPTDRARNS